MEISEKEFIVNKTIDLTPGNFSIIKALFLLPSLNIENNKEDIFAKNPNIIFTIIYVWCCNVTQKRKLFLNVNKS